jgi:hypothetical protein
MSSRRWIIKMNHNRRKFLKILAIGGGMALVSKFFGAGILGFFSPDKGQSITRKNIGNFQVEESKDGLTIFSKKGEEIFIIDDGE